METIGHDERRENTRLRALFPHAYPLLEPFFDPGSGWDSHTRQHVAATLLQDNFPELESHEVHTLYLVANRVYRERNPQFGGPSRPEARGHRRGR